MNKNYAQPLNMDIFYALRGGPLLFINFFNGYNY